jgi:hypothetical protein
MIWSTQDADFLRACGIAVALDDLQFDESCVPDAATLRYFRTAEYRSRHPLLYPQEAA